MSKLQKDSNNVQVMSLLTPVKSIKRY